MNKNKKSNKNNKIIGLTHNLIDEISPECWSKNWRYASVLEIILDKYGEYDRWKDWFFRDKSSSSDLV